MANVVTLTNISKWISWSIELMVLPKRINAKQNQMHILCNALHVTNENIRMLIIRRQSFNHSKAEDGLFDVETVQYKGC